MNQFIYFDFANPGISNVVSLLLCIFILKADDLCQAVQKIDFQSS